MCRWLALSVRYAFFSGAVLADLEFAVDARNGNAEAHDAGEHGAAKARGHGMPAFEIGRLQGLYQLFDKTGFTRVIFDQFERAVGVDCDVVPRRHGKRLNVQRGRNVTVRAGEDGQRFVARKRLPMRVGVGEMAFYEAVLAFVLYQERQMIGLEIGDRLLSRGRPRRELRRNTPALLRGEWRDRRPG